MSGVQQTLSAASKHVNATNDTTWAQSTASQHLDYQHGAPVYYAVDPSLAGPANSSNQAYPALQQPYYQYPVYNYTADSTSAIYTQPQGDYEETYQMQQTYPTQQQPLIVSAAPLGTFEVAGASSHYTPLPNSTTTAGSSGPNNVKSTNGTLFDSTTASYTADWVTQTTQILNQMREVPKGNDSNVYSPNAWNESASVQLSPIEPVVIENLSTVLSGLAVSTYVPQSVYDTAAYGNLAQAAVNVGFQPLSNFVQSQQCVNEGSQRQPQGWNVNATGQQQQQQAGGPGNFVSSCQQQNQNHKSQRPQTNFNNQNQPNFSQQNLQNRHNTSVATGGNAIPRFHQNTRGQRSSGNWRPTGNVRNAPSSTSCCGPPNHQTVETRSPQNRASASTLQWSPPSAKSSTGPGLPTTLVAVQPQVQQFSSPRLLNQYHQQQLLNYNQKPSNSARFNQYQNLPPEFNPTIPPPPFLNSRQQMPVCFPSHTPRMPLRGMYPYQQMQALMSYRGPPPQALRSFVPNQMMYGGPAPYSVPQFGGNGPATYGCSYNNGSYGQQNQYSMMGPPYGNQTFSSSTECRPYRNMNIYNYNRGRRLNGNFNYRYQQPRNSSTNSPAKTFITSKPSKSTLTSKADPELSAINIKSSSLIGTVQPLDAAMAVSVNRGAEFYRDETATPAPVGDKFDTQEPHPNTDSDEETTNEKATALATLAAILSD